MQIPRPINLPLLILVQLEENPDLVETLLFHYLWRISEVLSILLTRVEDLWEQ